MRSRAPPVRSQPLAPAWACRRRKPDGPRSSEQVDHPAPPGADGRPVGHLLSSQNSSLKPALAIGTPAPSPHARPETRFHSSSNATSFQPTPAGTKHFPLWSSRGYRHVRMCVHCSIPPCRYTRKNSAHIAAIVRCSNGAQCGCDALMGGGCIELQDTATHFVGQVTSALRRRFTPCRVQRPLTCLISSLNQWLHGKRIRSLFCSPQGPPKSSMCDTCATRRTSVSPSVPRSPQHQLELTPAERIHGWRGLVGLRHLACSMPWLQKQSLARTGVEVKRLARRQFGPHLDPMRSSMRVWT